MSQAVDISLVGGVPMVRCCVQGAILGGEGHEVSHSLDTITHHRNTSNETVMASAIFQYTMTLPIYAHSNFATVD